MMIMIHDAMPPEGRRAERRAVEPRATTQYMRRLGHDSCSACPYNIRTKMGYQEPIVWFVHGARMSG